MGDTVEAIGYKADVPARMRDAISDRVETVKESFTHAVSGIKEKSSEIDARRAVSAVTENPLGITLGALALGVLGGLMIPLTDTERERLAPIREELVDRAQTVIGETTEAGKAILRDGADAVVHSTKEHASTIASHMSADRAPSSSDAEI